MTTFGKTAAAFRLSQIYDKSDNKIKNKIGSIMHDFYIGFNFILSANNKKTFTSFWHLWMNEIDKRIESCTIPEAVKSHLHTTTRGIGRNIYKNKLISNAWGTSKQSVKLKERIEKHNISYKKLSGC